MGPTQEDLGLGPCLVFRVDLDLHRLQMFDEIHQDLVRKSLAVPRRNWVVV